ncbi:acidic mammalian chitinase-like [Ornithodoros turicata]|uniref:acidic mammalian chitinase-like n=1 Tax=Ornithodoros turicata TaxID=34597 RepID=UPI00313933C4
MRSDMLEMSNEIQRLGIVTALLVLCSGSVASEHYRRVCYYGPVHHVEPDFNDLDLKLCTHIIYGFSKVGDDNALVAANPKDEGRYRDFNRHVQNYNKGKEEALQVKTLLCVSKGAFPTMVATSENRTTFIQSALQKLKDWGDFGGLDVDWEFPNMMDNHPEEKENFKEFLEMAKRSNAALQTTSKPSEEVELNAESGYSATPSSTVSPSDGKKLKHRNS